MRFSRTLSARRISSISIVVAYAVLAISADTIGAPSTDTTPLPPITFSFDEAKFGEPMSEFSTDGLRISGAAVWSDPETDRKSYLLKWTRGADLKHKHTFSYQVVVLKGVMTHWTASLPGTERKQLAVGSVWYAPANEVHFEKCLTDECLTISTTFGPGTTIMVPDSH